MRPAPLLLLAACTGAPKTDDTAPADTASEAVDWAARGAYGAGTTAGSLDSGGRTVPVRVWYPSDTADAAVPLADLIVDTDDRATLAGLVDAAPAGCPGATQAVAVDGAPAAGPFPVVALSHCTQCLAVSNASVAAHLASWGFVVVAPDHTGNTLFDALEGDGGALDEETLAMRAADLRAALDAAEALAPDGLDLDLDRIAVVGHSFGAVTAGRVLDEDPRPQAAVFIGAPPDSPLLLGADAAALTDPTMFVVLAEDNSIGLPGNTLMASNYAEVSGPSTLATIADAGHWSVSDLCGVVDDFQPGCGDGRRQEGGADFTYIDADVGRATAGALVTAFLAGQLRGEDVAAWLAAPDTPAGTATESR